MTEIHEALRRWARGLYPSRPAPASSSSPRDRARLPWLSADSRRVVNVPIPTARTFGSPTTQRLRASDAPNRLGVFGSNKNRPFHRWYPFVEGYSAELVERALAHAAPEGVVLDPFGGSGTTALAAAMLGRDSVFAEVNPYLAWIAEVKINQSRIVAATNGGTSGLRGLAHAVSGPLPKVDDNHPLLAADAKRGFFPEGRAKEVLGLLALIDETLSSATREVGRLAVATVLVPASNMVRRTDLRKRVSRDPAPIDLREAVAARLMDCADDIDLHGLSITGSVRRIAGDVRGEWDRCPEVAVVVTSPPYLNGTNYCRNTKLELLALGFMDSEAGLSKLRVDSISAGINNISKRRSGADEIPCVERVAQKLDEVAYDQRIPTLVRTYFADMRKALIRVRKQAVMGARMYFDIGDSRYSGIHVPTHNLIAEIAEGVGWRLLGEDVIRTRRSYDGSQLTQVLLCFEAH